MDCEDSIFEHGVDLGGAGVRRDREAVRNPLCECIHISFLVGGCVADRCACRPTIRAAAVVL